MNIADVKQTLRGPLIPVITNLKDDLSIDHDAIRKNVEYVVERGIVKGQGVLLAVGAGGDFPILSVAERKSVAKTIQDAAAGRTPVLVGAQDTNVNVMVEMAKWADEIGIENVLKQLQGLQSNSNDNRYQPSPLLEKMVKSNSTFYA